MRSPSMNSQKITVIICTYNRAFILGECLNSLCMQTIPTEQFRVLVIDNNSTDNTRDIVAPFTDRLRDLQYIFEPMQGLSYARNRGLAEAQTEWVAFLDDDAKAHPDWVEKILATITKGDFDAFGGPFYAWHYFGPPPVWLPDIFDTYTAKQGYGALCDESYIPGGNCALKICAAKTAGGFPADMGMRGDKCAYAEEAFLFHKMATIGYRLGYTPEMKIDHCVLPHKYTFHWQLLSLFARGRSHQRVMPAQKTFMPLRCLYWYVRAVIKIALQLFHPARKAAWKKTLLTHLTGPLFYTGIVFERYFGRKGK